MSSGSLAIAFGAGLVAAFNPCGFAMLPAYLSYFLGLEDRTENTRASLLRALAVGAAVSAGFVAVFLPVGLLISSVSLSIERYLPWVTIVTGLGLTVLGVAVLRGFEPVVALPKLNRGGRTRELPAMFLFGVSYAVSSISCTIPVFIVQVVNAFTAQSMVDGLALFVAYAAGMALVLMTLTLALALARQGLVTRLRGVLPWVTRLSGGLLVLAGAYLVYWGWYELQVYGGNLDPGGPARWVTQVNGSITSWVQRTGAARIGGVLAVVVVAALGVGALWRSGGRRDRSGPDRAAP